MPPLSFLSPLTEVKASAIHGRGLFAKEEIPTGEVVAVKGGHIISREVLRELASRLGPAEIQIGDDLFICPLTEAEREGSMIFSNHSCEPNIGVRGQIVFVAMRDIRGGEELTHDWAMTDDDDSSTECRCGAATCRRTITGKDWCRPELQQRYGNFFSAYLLEKIRKTSVAVALAVVAVVPTNAFAQEAVMEEVRVEATFSSGLQLQRQNPAIDELLKRLELRDQQRRELELQEANKSSATKVIDLLKLPAWVPFGFGPSENKVDSFFQQNYMRADLNPRKENPLFTAD